MSPTLTLAELAPLIREAYKSCEFFWLYAIQAGERGPVKIGRAKSPAERLATLQTANAAELRGLAAWRGLPGEERYWHDRFAHLRIRGEWFKPDSELIDAVLLEGRVFCDWDLPKRGSLA